MHRESKAWYGDDEQLVLSVMTDAQISNRAEAERFADDIRAAATVSMERNAQKVED